MGTILCVVRHFVRLFLFPSNSVRFQAISTLSPTSSRAQDLPGTNQPGSGVCFFSPVDDAHMSVLKVNKKR